MRSKEQIASSMVDCLKKLSFLESRHALRNRGLTPCSIPCAVIFDLIWQVSS